MQDGQQLTFGLIVVLVAGLILEFGDVFSDPNKSEIKRLDKSIEKRLAETGAMLESHSLPKARLLAYYAIEAKRLKPQHADLIDNLAKGASRENPNLKDLSQQHGQAMKQFKDRSRPSREIQSDLNRIYAAAEPRVIDAALVDEINTIAALTEGELAQIEQPDDKPVNKAGALLVGNPHYGHWQHSSAGPLIWIWAGHYARFNRSVARERYDDWYYDRPWSYNYDVYRDRYASRTWRNREAGRLSKNWGRISQQGARRGRRPSSYATRRNPNLPGSAGSGRLAQDGFGAERQRMAQNGGRRVSSYHGSGRQGSGSGGYRPSNRSGGGYRGFSGK